MANVRVPGGANNISLDEEDLQRYRADPDGLAAEKFGLSKIEYIEWVELDGTPLCSHRTKAGDLCRNATSRIQQSASSWKAAHRKFVCSSHRS